jgi:prepilin-type N-terminal cleavage/methylation domain-containing protein
MKKHSKARGFSLVELLIVLAIIMVVSAMALPSMARGITTIRLRGAASTIAGMIQKTRIEAVRSNRIMVLREATLNDGVTPVFYVDGAVAAGTNVSQQNQVLDNFEPQAMISKEVQQQSSGYPSFDTNSLLGYNASPTSGAFRLAFNQRGLPCTVVTDTTSGITACPLNSSPSSPTAGTNSSYLYFFKLSGAFGDQWVAITVTPAGRVRTWVWNGANWS